MLLKRMSPHGKAGLLAGVLCATATLAMSQGVAARSVGADADQAGSLAPVDVTPNPIGRGDGMYIPLTKNQPFKIRFNVEITKPLPDGSAVKQKFYVLAARDSAGNEYRESRDPVPFESDREPALVSTTLFDPVRSTVTICFPARHNCQRRSFDPALQPAEQPGPGLTEDGQGSIRRESLGNKQRDGVEAVGIRETQTVKAGVDGNNKPLVTVRETWYAPQLQIFLSVLVTDPFGATRRVEATDLKRGEPGAEWFAIPDGYQILTRRSVGTQARSAQTLEQMVKQHVAGLSEEQLTERLKPVDAAVLSYARAHVAAAPNDPQNKSVYSFRDAEPSGIEDSRLVNSLRLRLSSEVQMIQMTQQRMNQGQVEDARVRTEAAYRSVLTSPCLTRSAPGDPPTMPANAAALEAEQKAWSEVYQTWTTFLKGLFPNSEAAGFGYMLANERAGELGRMQTVERNRGCVPEESLEASIERLVPSQTPAQLDGALKPVDAALNAYLRAHAADQKNENEENFARMTEARLAADLQQGARGRLPTRDQFAEAELHLNQALRAVMDSPCLDRHIPGDPPSAPVSGDKLRAEEAAWVALRDAWVSFVASLYPTNRSAGFGYAITEQRSMELMQIQNIERNRGCHSDQGN